MLPIGELTKRFHNHLLVAKRLEHLKGGSRMRLVRDARLKPAPVETTGYADLITDKPDPETNSQINPTQRRILCGLVAT